MSELFPGGVIVSEKPDQQNTKWPVDDLYLFYVGGVTPPLYDLRPLFDAVRGMEGISLTLCCRDAEWEQVKSYYAPIDESKVCIVHANGEGLKTYYWHADLFALIWRVNPYLSFAMPVKIFEALGYGVPILTTDGTEASRFVAKEGIGWVVSTMDELRELLSYLKTNPQAIAEKRRRVETVREHHTWQVRAQMVANILTREVFRI